MPDIKALVEQMENLILAWSESSGGSHLEIALAVLVLLEHFPMVGSIVTDCAFCHCSSPLVVSDVLRFSRAPP
jgi:hypothetical protein